MKTLFTRKISALGTFAVLAAITGSASAQGLPSPNLAAGEFVVDAKVVSDTVANSSSHVGDIPASTVGLRSNVTQSGGDCASGNCGGDCASGNCGGGSGSIGIHGRSYGQTGMFNNYYNGGYYANGGGNQANARMYMSPRPVPANVGHTFITYQPFNAHELLYHHTDKFHKYYDDGRGLNRTKAKYYSPPVRQAASNIYWNFLRLPR